jgi:hypothetical protein
VSSARRAPPASTTGPSFTGLGEPAYWRECKTCGIADVTATALGQDVQTPNDDREANDD